jgi:hypothetical protein
MVMEERDRDNKVICEEFVFMALAYRFVIFI